MRARVARTAAAAAAFTMVGVLMLTSQPGAQIPMERVLGRIAVPSTATRRGLSDTVGFPKAAWQMDAICSPSWWTRRTSAGTA